MGICVLFATKNLNIKDAVLFNFKKQILDVPLGEDLFLSSSNLKASRSTGKNLIIRLLKSLWSHLTLA